MNAQDVPGLHLLIPVTPVADSRLCASFSGWGMEHKPNQSWFSSNSLYPLTAVKPRTALTAHLCPPPHLSALCGTAFFLSEWLWSAFCTTDKTSGTRKKNQTNKKKKHNKTHHFFLLPSLQIIFKHLWLWQQQINKHSAAVPLSEPISLWPSLPQQFLSSLDTKTPAG